MNLIYTVKINLNVMRIKKLKVGDKVFTAEQDIRSILVYKGFGWVNTAEIDHAVLEIKDDTLVWHTGVWHYGDTQAMEWVSGIFRYGNLNDCLWHNGFFDGGQFVSGQFRNGVISGGVLQDGVEQSEGVQ